MKTKVIISWIIISSLLLLLYYAFPDVFSLETFENFKENYFLITLFIYFIALSLRGLFLFPSTPLLFLGIALFDPFLVFVVNMIAILISSATVYYFAQYLGLDSKLKNSYPKKSKKITLKLKDKKLIGITTWSVSPFVPTDLIVYIASTLRIKLWVCLFGVFIGEAILNTFYIISTTSVIGLF